VGKRKAKLWKALSELALCHNEATAGFFLDWCDRNDLLDTEGSDSHLCGAQPSTERYVTVGVNG